MRNILLFLISTLFTVSAQAQKFGKWEVLTNSEMHVARTVNSAKSYAGVICMHSSDSCTAYVSADDGCVDTEKYPLMVNAPTGSYVSESTCFTYENRQFLLIDETLSTVSAFESGGQVGFAIPLQGGQFRVVRFDGSGARLAIESARSLPSPSAPKRSQNPATQVL